MFQPSDEASLLRLSRLGCGTVSQMALPAGASVIQQQETCLIQQQLEQQLKQQPLGPIQHQQPQQQQQSGFSLEPLLPASCAMLQSIFEMQFAYHHQKLLAERELLLRDHQLQLSLQLLQNAQSRLTQTLPYSPANAATVMPTTFAFQPTAITNLNEKQHQQQQQQQQICVLNTVVEKQQNWPNRLKQQQQQTLLFDYETLNLYAQQQLQQQQQIEQQAMTLAASAFRAYRTPAVELSEEENATHCTNYDESLRLRGLVGQPSKVAVESDFQPDGRPAAGFDCEGETGEEEEEEEGEEASHMPQLLPECVVAFDTADCDNSAAPPPPLDAFDDGGHYAPLSIDCSGGRPAGQSSLINFVPTPTASDGFSECLPASIIVLAADDQSDRLLATCAAPNEEKIPKPAESPIPNDPSTAAEFRINKQEVQLVESSTVAANESQISAKPVPTLLTVIEPSVSTVELLESRLKHSSEIQDEMDKKPAVECLNEKPEPVPVPELKQHLSNDQTSSADKIGKENKKTRVRVDYTSDTSESSRISIAEAVKLEERRVPPIRLQLSSTTKAKQQKMGKQTKSTKRESAEPKKSRQRVLSTAEKRRRRPSRRRNSDGQKSVSRKRKCNSLPHNSKTTADEKEAKILDMRDEGPAPKKPALSRRRHTVGGSGTPRSQLPPPSQRRDSRVSRPGAALKIVSNWRPMDAGRPAALRLAGEPRSGLRHRCFSAVRHWSELDEVVRVNDCVKICSAEGLENIGKIVRFHYDTPSKAIMATILWYYTQVQVETTKESPKIVMHDKELLASKHVDTVNADCIEGVVYVLTYNEYSRFVAESRMRNLALESRPLELHDVFWTRADDAYSRRSLLPLEDTPSDLVYFCRAMYSIKTRKMYHTVHSGSYSIHRGNAAKRAQYLPTRRLSGADRAQLKSSGHRKSD